MAADNNEMVQHALQAYNEQRYDDALLLLKKYKADGTACDTWLRMRLAIKMEQWNHPWLRPPIKIERQNQSWRGALAQSFAEAAFLQAHYDEARKYYRLALRLGGKHMDEASVLRHLIIIHRRKGSVADAEQYARLLWYGRYPQSDRVFGGILYAQLIHAKNPAEARDVVSTIRVMPKLTIDQMVQSHVLLIKLLLPDQTLHAERVAIAAIQRLEQSAEGNALDEKMLQTLRLHHVTAVMYDAPRRALQLAEAYQLEADPIVQELRKQLEQDVFKRMEQARALIKNGKKRQALELLGTAIEKDAGALLLAIDAGLSLKVALASALIQDSRIALMVLSRAQAADDQQCVAFLRGRFKELLQKREPNGDDLSLMLLAVHQCGLSVAQQQRFEDIAESYEGQHEAYGMYLARRAELLQRQKSAQSLVYWSRAFQRLPSTHPWSVISAESLSLQVLRPVPPGTVVADLDQDRRSELQSLVKKLSQVAWMGTDEGYLRCRYLLGQALAQLGDLGQARIAFESMLPFANDSRKVRLLKALGNISNSGPIEP